MFEPKSVYIMAEDYYDYDGNDILSIMYHKGEHIFIYDAGTLTSRAPGVTGYHALVVSRKVSINYGPAGIRDLMPCVGKKLDLDITKPEDEAKLVLMMDGNMSIYDGVIRWN